LETAGSAGWSAASVLESEPDLELLSASAC
jgi:hypothetical protein